MNFMNKKPAYYTQNGNAYIGKSELLLSELDDESINLIITSPPFALQRQKEYGNKDQAEYVDWFLSIAEIAYKKLKKDGSFVVDLGGAYIKGHPVRSLYNFRVLLRMVDELGYFLAEDFYWFNPSKLPSPIEWVNKRKLRVKDSVNTVWWFSKSEYPKSDIKKVLVPYSEKMKKLIEDPDKYYKPTIRPSGHNIGKSFGKDNGGAIPSNLLQISNAESNSAYLSACKSVEIKAHPARFPSKLPEFFIKMLTDEGDTILDIFSGSNTTGHVAEIENRKWLSFDDNEQYVASSIFRFFNKNTSQDLLKDLYTKIINGESVDLNKYL